MTKPARRLPGGKEKRSPKTPRKHSKARPGRGPASNRRPGRLAWIKVYPWSMPETAATDAVPRPGVQQPAARTLEPRQENRKPYRCRRFDCVGVRPRMRWPSNEISKEVECQRRKHRSRNRIGTRRARDVCFLLELFEFEQKKKKKKKSSRRRGSPIRGRNPPFLLLEGQSNRG